MSTATNNWGRKRYNTRAEIGLMERKPVLRLTLPCLLTLCAVLAACAPPTPRYDITLVAPGDLPTSTFTDPVLIEGEANYNMLCGHCHGYEGEGQLEATIANTRALGMNLVPPANADGHMWEHPDQLLIRVVQEGIQNPLDQFPMAAFGEGFAIGPGLTESEIRAILEYIKLFWTDEQRAHQAKLTRDWDARMQSLGLTTPVPETTASPAD